MKTLKPVVRTLANPVRTLQTHSAAGTWRAGKESSTQRGYGYRWQQARAAFLKDHPLCECDDCQAGAKRLTPADVVDHRIPHRGDQSLFWDKSNWQAMAKRCHDAKTQREGR